MSSAASTVFNRDQLAKWYANRHFETDIGVEEIHYLPANAPEREIRFLEVNKLIAETTPLEPIDFGVDMDGTERHTLMVLDVTPSQWQQIQKDRSLLPPGWTLQGAEMFSRTKKP